MNKNELKEKIMKMLEGNREKDLIKIPNELEKLLSVLIRFDDIQLEALNFNGVKLEGSMKSIRVKEWITIYIEPIFNEISIYHYIDNKKIYQTIGI